MGQLNLRPRQSNFLLFIIIVNIMPNYTHRNGLRTAGQDGSCFLVVKSANTSVSVEQCPWARVKLFRKINCLMSKPFETILNI